MPDWTPFPDAPPPATTPRYRPSARIVVVDDDGCVLLAHHVDARLDDPEIWVLPGGGVDAGESHEQAALRELFEETGLADVPLGPWVGERRHVWRFGERYVDQHDRIFLLRTPRFTPSPGLVNAEVAHVRAWRWWSVDELHAASDQVFVPRRIASLVAVPTAPVDTGR